MASTTTTNATDSICEAVALHATAETEDFHYALKSGDVIDAVTQYRVNKKTGVASLCSHGGGCYPAKALRLTNCRIDNSKPDDDGDEIIYGLNLIRSKVPPNVLRQNDVELKLLELGMCNACADNAAAFYVKAHGDIVRHGAPIRSRGDRRHWVSYIKPSIVGIFFG